jgi:hypothetical protein
MPTEGWLDYVVMYHLLHLVVSVEGQLQMMPAPAGIAIFAISTTRPQTYPAQYV